MHRVGATISEERRLRSCMSIGFLSENSHNYTSKISQYSRDFMSIRSFSCRDTGQNRFKALTCTNQIRFISRTFVEAA
jgi:hypothetical protein